MDGKGRKDKIPPPPNPKDSPSVEELVSENGFLRSQLHDNENLMTEIDSLEQQRDLLTKTNARLQKQAIDKEDRNNNSMSEMLKFKQLHEHAKDENMALHQQVKKAEELAESAKMVEAVSKGIEQELQGKEKEMEGLETKMRMGVEAEKIAKIKAEAELAEVKNSMATTDSSVSQLKSRSDELVNELGDIKAAKNHLEEQLVCCKVERDKYKASGGTGGGGGGDQLLKLQVKNLKAKVTCHVCNDREKTVILKGCNHMFCSKCIETRLDNRDRKCPACGKKFSQKDVENVWLTG